MTHRDLTRRRVLALSGAAVGAALGIGVSSCSAGTPEPGGHKGSDPAEGPASPGPSEAADRDGR
ncbi:twin-arginine translocation signal domain-containing protein [Streptomyces sp. NPDC059618]|uniref:twin-arginine translocation signal domain-containing protein n=1 Tax=Streptomyces sp. NPDC059618 TaxID=3346887 RepID=UPI0036758F85